jgi:hypothetical protein
MSDKVFAKGLYVKPPKDNAPDFVKFGLSIKRQEVMDWLQGESDDWINLQVKEAKSGKWYAEVDTWKPDPNKSRPAQPQPDAFESLDEDIPFS